MLQRYEFCLSWADISAPAIRVEARNPHYSLEESRRIAAHTRRCLFGKCREAGLFGTRGDCGCVRNMTNLPSRPRIQPLPCKALEEPLPAGRREDHSSPAVSMCAFALSARSAREEYRCKPIPTWKATSSTRVFPLSKARILKASPVPQTIRYPSQKFTQQRRSKTTTVLTP